MKVCCAFRKRKRSTIWLKKWALCSKHSLLSFSLHRKIHLLYTQERALRKCVFSFLWRCEFPMEDSFSRVAVSSWNHFFSQLVACSHINPIKIPCSAPDWHWSTSVRQRVVPAPGISSIHPVQQQKLLFLGKAGDSLLICYEVINVAWYLLWQLLCTLFNHLHHGSQLFFSLHFTFAYAS